MLAADTELLCNPHRCISRGAQVGSLSGGRCELSNAAPAKFAVELSNPMTTFAVSPPNAKQESGEDPSINFLSVANLIGEFASLRRVSSVIEGVEFSSNPMVRTRKILESAKGDGSRGVTGGSTVWWIYRVRWTRFLVAPAALICHDGSSMNARLAWIMSKNASENTTVNGQVEPIHGLRV